MVQRVGDWVAVPNVSNTYPSTASVVIIVLLLNDLLLCGFNVPIKGLTAYCLINMSSKAVSDLAVFLRQFNFAFFLIERVLNDTATVVILCPIPVRQCL